MFTGVGMKSTNPGPRLRITWALGVLCVWTLVWAILGVHQLIAMGAHPHPFLPDLTLTGPILRAAADWALGAWLAYAILGLISAFLLLTAWILLRAEASAGALGFKKGLWQGLGGVLLVHGFLFWEVPAALTTLPGARHLPMGLALLGLMGAAGFALAKGLGATRAVQDWVRIAAGCLVIGLLLQVPHDLFRRAMPRPDLVDPGASRLLVYSIDGCRKDVLEKVMPSMTAPVGVEPVVAIPATRLTWNILLGGDPETLSNSYVVPFRSEWDSPSPAKLLETAAEKGLSSCFLIDDSTTLSFGLTRAKFKEVLEPQGGWKHYFTVGAGACWPIYSWLENLLSPVETTNPWADFGAYNRDVGRALLRHRMVFSHTCQLHAPFYPRREELQVLRPWKWLWHTAYAYQSYQAFEEALATHFDRQDGRSNPKNHYRIRLERLLRLSRPAFDRWAAEFPALSAVLTSDHGEAFLPIITEDRTLVNYLTGIHGFTLDPETVRVPLHPFGKTDIQALKPGAFSWYDLRQCLQEWIQAPDVLRLKQIAPEGWLLSFPTIQATHAKGEDEKGKSQKTSAGMTPSRLARMTYLSPSGIWFMDNPPEDLSKPVRSQALVTGPGMVTFNPLGGGQWVRETWVGYDLKADSVVSTEAMETEIARFPGKRPEVVFPFQVPSPSK